MTSFKCRLTKWFLFQRDGFQCAPWKFQQSVDNSTITHCVFCHIELKQSCFLMFFGGLCLKLYLEWITQRLLALLVLQVDWRVTLQILLPAFYIQESFRTCPINWKSENMLKKTHPVSQSQSSTWILFLAVSNRPSWRQSLLWNAPP